VLVEQLVGGGLDGVFDGECGVAGEFAVQEGGVDPVRWTPDLLGGCPRCRRESRRIRLSSDDSSSRWSELVAPPRSCLGSSSRLRSRSATGFAKRIVTRAAATTG